MKTINLTDINKSDIQYKISNYPDGQSDIVINNSFCKDNLTWFLESGKYTGGIKISSRFNSFKDLELIICATKALRRLGVKEIHLYIPYLLGARSDRQFQEGGTGYLVDVIAPIINSLNFESVTVIDVHNPEVTSACINNLKVINNTKLVNFFLNDIAILKEESARIQKDNIILISPDQGFLKKIYKVAESIGYKDDIICCSKTRDINGKLSNTIVPIKDTGPLFMKDYIIIDDICDGGNTFINISKELKKLYNCNKTYLIVTHGIFSKGFEELSKYFDGIYTTNSVGTLYSDTKIDSWIGPTEEQYYPEIPKDLIKQLNIF